MGITVVLLCHLETTGAREDGASGAGGISAYKRRVFSRFLWEGSNSA